MIPYPFSSEPDPVNRIHAILRSLWRDATHLAVALHPVRRRREAEWMNREGVDFFRDMGVREGGTVVDVGCGYGAYSLPAARRVGANGLVVSVDLNGRALKRLLRTARTMGLRNIRAVASVDELKQKFPGGSCDAVLFYDMLHYWNPDERRRLYGEARHLLKPGGVLSVFPMHLKSDRRPARYFGGMVVGDVVREIEAAGWRLAERREAGFWHDHRKMQGTLLNFRRAAAADALRPDEATSESTQGNRI